MACLCRCGRVIDCGDTECDLCAVAADFYVLPPEELPRSGFSE